MTDWFAAVYRIIERSTKNKSTDRLDIIDFIALNKHVPISTLDGKCGGSIRRDNRFVNPVTKWVHGKQKRASSDNWLPFDPETRMYTVHPDFASAWKQARGL